MMTDKRMPGSAATIRQRAGRAIFLVGLAALAFAAIVGLSGGVTLRFGSLALPSGTPWRALMVAAVAIASARALLGGAAFTDAIARVKGPPSRRASRAAVVLAFAAFVVATAWNTRAAGGSDSSCYLLQADAFAHGRATLAAPLSELPPALPPVALAPAGFVPSPKPPFEAVPICPPGLALLMTPAVIVHRDAPFLVVPLFAALAVWLTFLLGRAWADDRVGIWSAVLLGCSPIFLYQAVQPMSDVPAVALTLGALVGASRGGRRGAIVSGLCVSLAVLTRPNLAVLVPLLALLLTNGDRSLLTLREKWDLSPFLWFAVAMAPGAAVMLVLNAARYGAPLASGYGDTGALFSWAHVAPNLARYPRWLLETHSPALVLAIAAPVILWTRGRVREALAGTLAIVAVVATYVFYTVFDDWWYIRFLLPVLPVILIFAVITAWRIAASFSGARLAVPMGALLLAGWYLDVAHSRHALRLQALESRFRAAGDYAARDLPANAIVFAVQLSGSVRYHGERRAVAWDGIPGDALDETVAWLRARGDSPFIALEDEEEPVFRHRFVGERLGALERRPTAELRGLVRVRFYEVP